jgi:hypothetical protein
MLPSRGAEQRVTLRQLPGRILIKPKSTLPRGPEWTDQTQPTGLNASNGRKTERRLHNNRKKFVIKRPSSPISLNQRKKKESYSEKAKQKTTFEETEPEKEARTDRQPRLQSKMQPTEQQTPQRKRRAEVTSPERPMSISPSPRRSPPRRTPRRSPSNRRRASRTPDRATARPTTGRSSSRKASRRNPSRAEYRNPSPRRTRATDSREDYHYSYRQSPEYQTPDSSPSARRRANLYTSSSNRNKME